MPFIFLNVEMHYGLMAATMPTLKPFVSAFNTGFGTYDTQGISGYGKNSHGSYVMQSLGRKSNRKGSTAKGGSSADRENGEMRPSYGKNVTHVRSIIRETDPERASDSSENSQQMIIHQTNAVTITYEDEARRDPSLSRTEDSTDYISLQRKS